MFAGVGIIGALASILASILVPPPKSDDDEVPAVSRRRRRLTPSSTAAILAELTALRAEVRALHDVRPAEPG